MDRFKVRLVAKGYTQKKDFDDFDTFASMTRIASIRVLFVLASIHKPVIHQMDVKTIFLNEKLREEIYMDQHKGYVTTGNEHRVYKPVKSLYGFKTSTQIMTW